MAKAAEVLSRQFTLVCTNVPYLGRGKQDDVLKEYSESVYPDAKADLSTCFVERCLEFCATGGSVALVTPQNWLFLGTYKKLRRRLLQKNELSCVTRLGPNAFRDMNWWAATTALLSISRRGPSASHGFAGIDVADCHEPDEKAAALCTKPIARLKQRDQLDNPDARLSMGDTANLPLLKDYADCLQGTTTGDNPRHVIQFWELPAVGTDWEFFQATVERSQHFGGRQEILRWQSGRGELAASSEARVQGHALFGRVGVFVGQMRELPVTLFSGQFYNMNGAALVPRRVEHLPAIWAFCSSPEFRISVRELDQALKVTNATLVKVPFDLSYWERIAAEQLPDGLPRAHSNDPTQWLFSGAIRHSDAPLQVAIARLVGYRWPRQTDSFFLDCPAVGPDGLESHGDEDGIVCLPSLRGEAAASKRVREMLADAFGAEWSAQKLNELLANADFAGKLLDDWLRDGFFEQHCALFHQRPFIWQIWDGRKDGFSALVNYHQLAASNGEGRRILDKLAHTYLGDWLDRQRADQKAGVEGADGRVAAAVHLKSELEKVLEGEPPYDLFVRWKPLHQQPIGWEPDIDDGVRVNIRPFMTAKPLNTRGRSACILRVAPKIKWDKDRGKEPTREKVDYPWFWGWDESAQDFAGRKEFDGNRWNDLHYSRAVKLAARVRAKGDKS